MTFDKPHLQTLRLSSGREQAEDQEEEVGAMLEFNLGLGGAGKASSSTSQSTQNSQAPTQDKKGKRAAERVAEGKEKGRKRNAGKENAAVQ